MVYPMVGMALMVRGVPDAEVIAAKKGAVENDTTYIILCHLKDNDVTPYVTWVYDAGRVLCFHGHYCYDINEAAESFNERGGF